VACSDRRYFRPNPAQIFSESHLELEPSPRGDLAKTWCIFEAGPLEAPLRSPNRRTGVDVDLELLEGLDGAVPGTSLAHLPGQTGKGSANSATLLAVRTVE
jgi:hypothetical protein